MWWAWCTCGGPDAGEVHAPMHMAGEPRQKRGTLRYGRITPSPSLTCRCCSASSMDCLLRRTCCTASARLRLLGPGMWEGTHGLSSWSGKLPNGGSVGERTWSIADVGVADRGRSAVLVGRFDTTGAYSSSSSRTNDEAGALMSVCVSPSKNPLSIPHHIGQSCALWTT